MPIPIIEKKTYPNRAERIDMVDSRISKIEDLIKQRTYLVALTTEKLEKRKESLENTRKTLDYLIDKRSRIMSSQDTSATNRIILKAITESNKSVNEILEFLNS